jgi:mRNA interferase RelE/StbE
MQKPGKGVSLSEYRIFETEQFTKDLQRIARGGHAKVAEKLQTLVYAQLREHPHFGPNIKKLKGFQPETWRYRIGAWRFFYEIDESEKTVFMIAAHHRSTAY